MDIQVFGVPETLPSEVRSVFRSRVIAAYQRLFEKEPDKRTEILISSEDHVLPLPSKNPKDQEEDKERSVFIAQKPFFDFNDLILNDDVFENIKRAVEILKFEHLIFDEWGLRKLEPHPKCALNFYGPPGTGKTMAAHAIANYLKKNIITASYAEIESKYHGEGPKNVKRLFDTAEENDAVLFIDEADSLLSKRLTNVSQGSEQAINSMRSQLLINLELFHGVVIFATNLVNNYDKAFETRIQHIQFHMPDIECRKKIWMTHLISALPQAPDVDAAKLSEEFDDICGRDIKNAVIQSAIEAAIQHTIVSHSLLGKHILKIKKTRITDSGQDEEVPLSDEEKKEFERKIIAAQKRGRRRKK